MTKKQCLIGTVSVCLLSFYNISLKRIDDVVAIIVVNCHRNGIHKVKAENTHNGFRINNVSAAGKVDITFELANNFYKIAYRLNGIQGLRCRNRSFLCRDASCPR